MIKNSRMTLAGLLLSSAAVVATSSNAETILRALDGSFELKGDTVTYDDENYVLQTQQGELIVRREFMTCIGDDCPPEEQPIEVAEADKVVLQSLDGTFELTGVLADVTETDFVVETGQGSVSVRREFVTCEGATCPSDLDEVEFAIAVAGSAGAELLSTVVGDFAASKDYSVTQSVAGGNTLATLLVGDGAGEEVANISVDEMADADGLNAVLNGEVAFLLTQEKITPETILELTGNVIDDVSEVLTETTIGLDALSFVTHPDNKISVLSIDDISAVLTGEITSWAQLGGADEPINVHIPADKFGVTRQLTLQLLEDGAVAPNHTVHEATADLNAAVKSDEHAMGVMYMSHLEDVKPLDLVGNCDIFFDNNEFSVQTEEYPLTVRMYQYTANEVRLPDFATNISDFIVTDVGQESVASQGLITQQLRVSPIQDQGARLISSVLSSDSSATANRVMRQYLAEAANAERLSTSLRFLTGQSVLDAKAVDDIKRISSIVRSETYKGYEVLVFGFTDSVGAIGNNITLANRRAEAVKQILLSENVGILEDDAVTTFGMGPIAPVNCNDEDAGRQLNRRVEVWIRPKA